MGGQNKLIILFDDQPVRRVWDEKEEKWYFSVVDIIAVLTGSSIPRRYWMDLKRKLQEEGSQAYEKIVQLKLVAPDGKKRETDVADVETLFRLIQSVPSPKAEPFKLWLARVGYERMQETVDPELAVARGRRTWQALGRSKEWIEKRMLGIEIRNKLTDYWSGHEIKKGDEYAKLTNIIHKEWSELTVKEHKDLKGLQQENLRDHMDTAELLFTALAELSTKEIAGADKAVGYDQNKKAAHEGGKISGNARKELEKKTGKKVVNGGNFLSAGKNKELK